MITRFAVVPIPGRQQPIRDHDGEMAAEGQADLQLLRKENEPIPDSVVSNSLILFTN